MLSSFVLAYALGPLMLGGLSELYGRRNVLQLSNIFFIIFNLACGFAQTRVQLTIFRFFAGLGGSTPLAIGGGVISDLATEEERGKFFSYYTLAPLLGPAIAPLVGGWIVESLQTPDRWRWIFWVVTIFSAAIAAGGLFLLPETYQPRILDLKCRKLRKETGNDKLRTVFQKEAKESFAMRFQRNMRRPFVLIATQPIVQLLSVYSESALLHS